LSLDPPRDAEEVSVMTTAIIGTGAIGSVIARQLASGGETLPALECRH
jgi:lactate dehydrogenase-like 2-hydroxyacid dehydrogenase